MTENLERLTEEGSKEQSCPERRVRKGIPGRQKSCVS